MIITVAGYSDGGNRSIYRIMHCMLGEVYGICICS